MADPSLFEQLFPVSTSWAHIKCIEENTVNNSIALKVMYITFPTNNQKEIY